MWSLASLMGYGMRKMHQRVSIIQTMTSDLLQDGLTHASLVVFCFTLSICCFDLI